jgi:hypothetical protein
VCLFFSPAREFDYSRLRAAGTPIRGFGGVAAGADVLRTLIERLQSHSLRPAIGHALSITCIVDIFNLIGTAVVAGNVRQTAGIAFGPPRVADPAVTLSSSSSAAASTMPRSPARCRSR